MDQLIKQWKETVDMYSRQLESLSGGQRTHSGPRVTNAETIERIKRWRSELIELIDEYGSA